MAPTCRHCAKHTHRPQLVFDAYQMYGTPPTKKPKSRFKPGQIVRYRGSPSMSRANRPNVLATVEFVGQPGPQQSLNVRLVNGFHDFNLAERFVPVRLWPRLTWARECAKRHTLVVCEVHGPGPDFSISTQPAASGLSAFTPRDTRSEGAKRYDAMVAARTPDWVLLGYVSQDEMERALA